MRLLVITGHPLLAWIVQHLEPDRIEVDQASTMNEVRAAFSSRPPQAVIVDATPGDCRWCDIVHLCRAERPPIPILFYLGSSRDEPDVELPREAQGFFGEPRNLKRHLERVLRVG